MSSTYSSDLRIQLMGTGDQAGTWGATTNNNFQYIFEQAIAGLQTVSVTATPQALTYLNGATSTLANNQAICAALIFTNGGVNANFTITTPSGSQKTYIVYNNTSYTATLQVTGSSGSTVAIPSQVTTTVYTDGTNFYAGSTGTVGSFGVNGALTVTGNASVSGNETITGTLAVTGTTTHTGAVALNGGGTSTTPSSSDNSTKIATTAFVQTALPSSGTPLSAASGGTGEAGTLTGVLYGNGTSAHTVASASQIVSAIGSTAVANATTASNVSGGYVTSVNGSQGAVTVTIPVTLYAIGTYVVGRTADSSTYGVSATLAGTSLLNVPPPFYWISGSNFGSNSVWSSFTGVAPGVGSWLCISGAPGNGSNVGISGLWLRYA